MAKSGMRDLVTCQAKWVLWSPPSARQTSLTLESSDDRVLAVLPSFSSQDPSAYNLWLQQVP